MSDFSKGSTGIITVSFVDEDGKEVVPNAITWTLSKYKSVVNNRKDVVVAVPAAEIDIVLSGADLPSGFLVLCVSATYDSSRGINLPLKITEEFEVEEAKC